MHRAFTLLELMAVTVLLAMAMAVGASGFAGADGSARLGAAAAEVLDLDRRARLTARAGADVELVAGEESLALVGNGGERLAQVRLPAGLSALLFESDDNAPVKEIRFDRCGRSIDYVVRLESPDRSVAFSVAGLTGWSRAEGPRR